MTPNPTPLWQRDESLREAGAILAEKATGIRVVSFDFFDTLVSRLCGEPSDLFIEVGRQLAARGLLVRPLTPMEFLSTRIAADERARKNATRRNRSSEVRLDDIYAELQNVVADVAAARQVEFNVERQYLFPNPATLSLAEHARALGFKVAVISDTYFTEAELHQFLRENGASPSLFDKFFVSSDCGKAKWNGQLYHDLFRHFDILPGELLHFGDNERVDTHTARQLGARAVPYYKTNLTLDRLLASERKLRATDFHPAGALNAVRIHTARRAESDQDAFRDGAFVFGPVLARYADWCVGQFKNAGVRTVLALMREGELLGELVGRSAAAAGVDLNIVTCYTSRRATARAALSEITPAGAVELLEGSATVTLQSILDVLGLGEEIVRQFDPPLLAKPLAMDGGIMEVLKLLFDNPRVQQLLKAGCAESHALANDYLKSLTGGETRVGILDIGWGGSIQRNIARILRRGNRDVRTVGCYLARTRKAGRLALDGDEMHAFMEEDWCRSTILAELAISSPVGSTNEYVREANGAVRPVLGRFDLSPEEQQIRRRLREGILEFQSFWLDLLTRKAYSPETLADIDRQTASIFYRLLDFPSKSEADRLGGLTHDENYFGENLTAPLCDESAARQLRADGMHTLVQSSKCHWPQGILAREHPRLINALSLTWTDIPALGRLGARQGTPRGVDGLTDEETSSLGVLLGVLQLQQIVHMGTPGPALAEILSNLWRQERNPAALPENQPRLIVVSSENDSARPDLPRCLRLPVDPNDLSGIRSARTALAAGVNAALVLAGEFSETTLTAWINGLGPFLGRQGAILVPCGRYGRADLNDALPAVEPVKNWLRKNARELGFGSWFGPAPLRPHLANWIILRRAPDLAVWNHQWTFTAADLALAEPTDDLLVAQP